MRHIPFIIVATLLLTTAVDVSYELPDWRLALNILSGAALVRPARRDIGSKIGSNPFINDTQLLI